MIAVFAISFTSCSNDDDRIQNTVDYDTYSLVYDLKNINFQLVNGFYQIQKNFNNPLYESDVVLVYRKVGNTNNGAPIWQLIPITYYLNGGHEVDYTFDFSRYDIVIYTGGTFDLALAPEYINNQTFRVVTVPAEYGKNAENQVDYSDYEAVIDYFKIDDTKIINL